MVAPEIMGVLNVTPDSFSDGGHVTSVQTAIDTMIEQGADIIDIGGESTRPGAKTINLQEELARVKPAIDYMATQHPTVKFSIDTRKAMVAEYALNHGAFLFNDVSALTYDAQSLAIAKDYDCQVCLMHAQGSPQNMQNNPHYDDVVADVLDWLRQRIDAVVHFGIDRSKIIIDPGIGFGKTRQHNLALIRDLSRFSDMDCPILLGASRKRFIGDITQEPEAQNRLSGSLAVALYAITQNAHILRVHDVKETWQAVTMWQAIDDRGDND